MEIRDSYKKKVRRGIALCTFILLLLAACSFAQPSKAYTVKNGRMYVQLPKNITVGSLDSFAQDFDLVDLDLFGFIKTGRPDSLKKRGWNVEVNNETGVIISKVFEPYKGADQIIKNIFKEPNLIAMFPSVNNGLAYGVNSFRNKSPFSTRDSVVRFYLRNFKNARQVMLAGSFNKWVPDQLAMQ